MPALSEKKELHSSAHTIRNYLLFSVFMSVAVFSVGRLDVLLTPLEAATTQLTLFLSSIFGISASYKDTLLTVDGFRMSFIGECTAIHFILIFSLAVLFTPKQRPIHRIIGVTTGIPAIIFVNSVRLVLLGIVGSRTTRPTFDIIHDFIFQILMAILVLVMWLFWSEQKTANTKRINFCVSAILFSIFYLCLASVAGDTYLYVMASATNMVFSGMGLVDSVAASMEGKFSYLIKWKLHSISYRQDIISLVLLLGLFSASIWQAGAKNISMLVKWAAIGAIILMVLQLTECVAVGVLLGWGISTHIIVEYLFYLRFLFIGLPIVMWWCADRNSSMFIASKPLAARLALFLLLSSLVCTNSYAAETSPPSLIILPPSNKTNIAGLYWLSVGIQDSMNVSLWGVSNVRARAITEYGTTMGYNVERLSKADNEAAVKLAQEAKVDFVWRGEYSLADKDSITLAYWILDSKNGTVLHKHKINGPLTDISHITSRMTLALLSSSAVPVTALERERIAKPNTTSIKAYEQNSLGFGKQLQRMARKGGMMFDKLAWIEHYKKAITIDPNYAEAYVNLGWALHSDGSIEAAHTAFSTAVKLKPFLLDGWMGLGYVYRDKGNNSKALDAFQQAVAINSHLEWPRGELKKVIAITTPVQVVAAPISQSPSLVEAPATEVILSVEEKSLRALAENESLDIRIDAIRRIARTKKNQALPFLKEMINRQDQAFEVLKLIADISIPDTAPYLVEALEKRITPDGSRLSSLTEQNVLGVIQLIKRRAQHQAIPVLMLTLADKSAGIRESTALALGDLGKQEPVEALRKFVLTEKNTQVRTAAHVALMKLGDGDSREVLRKLLSDGSDMEIINYATKLMKQRKLNIDSK